MQDEMTYPAPPTYPPPQPRRPIGLIVTAAILSVAFLAAAIFAGIETAALASSHNENEALTAEVQDGNKALAEAKDTTATLQDDLAAARGAAATCEKAANLLAKGQTGYVRLWNRVKDAADRWRYVFDFYLYGLLRRDEVSDAQISAAWDALDECTSGNGITSL